MSASSQMSLRLCVVVLIAVAAFASEAQSTEIRIRVPQPAEYSHPVHVKKAQLLLAWWGDTETVELTRRYEGNDVVITVPLDREVWTSLKAVEPPDFAYVYFEFEDFVPVRSDKFYWLGGTAPAPSPRNWETVSVIRFGFRGGGPIEMRSGEERELSLAVRRPVSKQLRFVDDLGRAFTDITVDGGMFWSAHNHCGVPSGVEPLFTNIRPNGDGVLTVPDGEIEYGFQIRNGGHISVAEPQSEGGFLVTYIDAPEFVARIHRHVRVSLTVQVTIAGKPAPRVVIGASVPTACGNGSGPLGRTDDNGVLHLLEFYPEEFEAICVSGADGRPLWATRPRDQRAIQIDLPAGALVGEPQYCFVP